MGVFTWKGYVDPVVCCGFFVSITNSDFEALLRKCFTPVEAYSFVIRCYGYELPIEPPQLGTQEDIYFVVTQAIRGG